MQYYKLTELRELPQAEQQAIMWLVKANVSMIEISTIENYTYDRLEQMHRVTVTDCNKNKRTYNIDCSGVLQGIVELYNKVKPRSTRRNTAYEQRLAAANSFFSI